MTTKEMRADAGATNPDYPVGVQDAALYLGVSAQTVYLWVERKQIPHLRDGSQHSILEIGFGAIPRKFQTRGGEWQDQVNTMEYCIDEVERSFGGCGTTIAGGSSVNRTRCRCVSRSDADRGGRAVFVSQR
jgi:excisionase family DNA binding protein